MRTRNKESKLRELRRADLFGAKKPKGGGAEETKSAFVSTTTETRWKAGGERKRMLLLSWRVDRWRFFTHLARRASICIKLIGSPYWLLLLRSKRDGNSVAEERTWKKRRGNERARRREDVGARSLRSFPPSSFLLPLSSNVRRE